MTEAELMEEVRRMCEALRLDVFHVRDSRGSWGPGFPDLVIAGTRILFRECKSHHGSLQPDQRRWGSKIQRGGGDWCVWRPRDLADGTIAAQLTAISPLSIAAKCTDRTALSPLARARISSSMYVYMRLRSDDRNSRPNLARRASLYPS